MSEKSLAISGFSSAVIALLNGDAAVEQIANEAEELFMPVIVLGELYYALENPDVSSKICNALKRL